MGKKISVALVIVASTTLGIDTVHSWKPGPWSGEPRFEQPWLTSLDISILKGSTLHSRTYCGTHATLFGVSNLHHLGAGLTLDATNSLDQTLIDMLALSDRACFAHVDIRGSLAITEAMIDLRQNFVHGFFARLHLPIRSIRVERGGFSDLSPQDTQTPNINTPPWPALLANFDAILARHGLTMRNRHITHTGDTTLLLGWTKNYQDTDQVDFIDTTIQAGILFPTGTARNSSQVLDLATGYDDHYGGTLSWDIAWGLWEWITIGCNSGLTYFDTQTQHVHVKTDPRQHGIIKLAHTCADVHPGLLWHIGVFAKIDHIINNIFSFTAAYSFNQQEPFTVHVPAPFNQALVESDQQFTGWNMHTLHLAAEFDLGKEDKKMLPRLVFSINIPLYGKNIIDLTLGGISGGIDITWHH